MNIFIIFAFFSLLYHIYESNHKRQVCFMHMCAECIYAPLDADNLVLLFVFGGYSQ